MRLCAWESRNPCEVVMLDPVLFEDKGQKGRDNFSRRQRECAEREAYWR